MGNIGSKTWSSFGAELADLNKITQVEKSDWTASHRNTVVSTIVKEYILHKVQEHFKHDEDLKEIWFTILPTGSFVTDTMVREADDFDFLLLMDNVPGTPTPINAAKDVFSLDVMRRRPANGRHSYGSDRETGESEDHHVNIGFIEGMNMGPKYVSEFVPLPIQKIKMHINNLVEKFTIHNPNEAPWLSRLTDIYPESLIMKVRKRSKKITSSFNLRWMDSVRNELHDVTVDIVPAYRDMNKTMGEFWTPPSYFDDEETVLGKKKSAILSKPVVMVHNPPMNGWTLNYRYADDVIFDHLRRHLPTALTAFRLLKVLRDATLPWTCITSPQNDEVLGVTQLVSSFVLQNMFFHELVQEPDPADWTKERILYRIIGMLQKLNGLVQFRENTWVSQSNVYNPGQNTLLGKPLPVTSDVKRLIDLLNLRNQQYMKGSVSIKKECHTPGKADAGAAEETEEEKCINSWNHHYFLQFTKPTPSNQCKGLLYTDIASAGGMFQVDSPAQKKVRMFQECSGINLDRYLPDGFAKILVVSWNTMESETVPQAMQRMLLAGRQHDIYVIGTQETKANRKEWEAKILSVLGDNYSVFYSGNHWALSLIIVMKNDLIPFASEAEDDTVTVSPKIRWIFKTKGAIAACFRLFDTSLLFVNSHLTAREHMMKKRIDDYHEICQDLNFPKQKQGKGKGDLNSQFDCVFWLGDLNFHMSGGKKKWKKQDVDVDSMLAKYDELQVIQKEGKAFKNFKEGKIRFPPTFRYDPGTVTIHIKREEENPSYTDRILYKCKDPAGVKCLHYDIVLDALESDHKPVQGVFKVPIKTNEKGAKCAAKDSPVLQGKKRLPRGDSSPRMMRAERPPQGMVPYPAAYAPQYAQAPSYLQQQQPPMHPRSVRGTTAVFSPAEQRMVAYKENIPARTNYAPPSRVRGEPVGVVVAPPVRRGNQPFMSPLAGQPPAPTSVQAAGMKSVFAPGNKDFSWKTIQK